MKHSLLFLLVSLCFLCGNAQTVLVKDSTHFWGSHDFYDPQVRTYSYNTDCLSSSMQVDVGLYNHDRYTYTYYPNQKLFRSVYNTLSNTGEVTGTSRATYVYTPRGKVKAIKTEVLQNGTYVNSTLNNNDYNAQNLPVRKFVYLWNAAENRFVNNSLDSIVYTAQNQINKVFTYLWNSKGVKKLTYRADTVYNPDNTFNSIVRYDYTNTGAPAISAVAYQYTYYDTLKLRYQLVTTSSQSNGAGNWTVVNTKITHHDSANYVSHDTSFLSDQYGGTSTEYRTRTYTTGGKPLKDSTFHYSTDLLSQYNANLVYTYNTDGTLQSLSASYLYPYGSFSNHAWYYGYTYGTCTPGAVAPLARTAPLVSPAGGITAVLVSPNPAVGFFTIRRGTGGSAKLNATLYNTGGKAQWTSGFISAEALNNKQVATAGLANGMYYLRITNAAGAAQSNLAVMVAH